MREDLLACAHINGHGIRARRLLRPSPPCCVRRAEYRADQHNMRRPMGWIDMG